MPAVLAGPLGRLRSAFETISLGQKVVIGLLVAGLGLGGFFFYNWVTTPTMAPLFSNLASTDASAIVDELNASGAPYELADGGGTIAPTAGSSLARVIASACSTAIVGVHAFSRSGRSSVMTATSPRTS